jgi:PmbA protein
MSSHNDSSNPSLLGLARSAVSYAKERGLDGCKISASKEESLRVTIENGEFTLANHLDASGFGVAVHHEQKRGSATVNSVASKDLFSAIDQAQAIASYSVADPYLIIADQSIAPPAEPLTFLYDEQFRRIDQAEMQDLMLEVLKDCLQHPKLALERFEVSLSFSEHHLVNSLGVEQSERQSALWWSFVGMARDKDEVSGMDYVSHFSFRDADIRQRMRRDAEEFVGRVIGNLHPRKAPAYTGEVLLSPRAAKSLLLSTILFHSSGSQVMDNKSRWATCIGDEVASNLITITDYPHEDYLAGASAFDGDGVPTRINPILDQGVLKQHLHSCYSANRTSTKTTASAGGQFGLRVSPGTSTLADMQLARKELLVVDRFSGNVDPLTGDFSGVAKTSRLLANGEKVGPVHETMISGNSFEILKGVKAISREVECVSGSYCSPWFLVAPITVS